MKIDLSGLWSYAVKHGPEGTVRVPSAYDFIGEVTFHRSFEINPADVDLYQFHLVILGANYNTSATINGDFITSHLGGYTSFVAPIPSSVLQGGKENLVKITTDNRLDATKTIPLRTQVWDWRNYGGILRDIYVLATPKVFISDAHVTSSLNKDYTSARISIKATFDGSLSSDVPQPPRLFSAELFDKQTNTLVASSQSVPVTAQGKDWNSVSVEMSITNPRLWSPEIPDLYYLKTYLVDASSATRIDEYNLVVGIREIDLSDGKIKLNGKRKVLKGMIWMEDHPSFGSALTYEAMEKDVVMMKSIGTNAVRFGHHPPHPYMLNLCDRYGLLALEELPAKNVPVSILAEEYYVDLASTMMREMILRDRNHPSVFAWGLGDEFEPVSAARAFVEPLVNLAKSLDGRPVYYATRNRAGDECSDLTDISVITLLTRDVKDFRKQLDGLRLANSTKPIIIGRMGSEVRPGNHNGYSDPLSLEAQARYMLQHIDAVRLSNIDGSFVWSFNDWKGDRPALTVNSGDPWMHTPGIVASDREKRLAYEAVRSAFNGERFVALSIGSNPSAPPVIYVVAGLVLLISTAYLYNANRRFREGLNRSMVNAYNFFADVRDQRIVTILHSTLLGLVVSAGMAIVTSSFLYHFRDSVVLDNMLSYVLISDTLKEVVVGLILNPMEFLLVITFVLFFFLLLVSMMLLLIGPVFKTRMYPFHAYAITMWSTPPLLALVPIGMILYRLMDSNIYVLPAIMIVFLLHLWVLFRFLKGIAIILDVFPAKVYVLGFLSLAGVITCLYLYLDYTQSASVYMGYLYNEMMGRAQ